MTIPKELNLPIQTDFSYYFTHIEEYCARELVEHMAGKPIESRPDAVMKLPYDSLNPNQEIHVAPCIDLPAGNHELSGIIGDKYNKLDGLAPLYKLFDLEVNYRPENRLLNIRVAGSQVAIATDQTFYNYSGPAYLHMVQGLFACFSQEDKQLIEQIRNNGVLISTLLSSSETALAIPGDVMSAQNLATLPWQDHYEPHVLYPIDLHRNVYEVSDRQGYHKVRESMSRLLLQVQPVGVHIVSDSIANVYINRSPRPAKR